MKRYNIQGCVTIEAPVEESREKTAVMQQNGGV